MQPQPRLLCRWIPKSVALMVVGILYVLSREPGLSGARGMPWRVAFGSRGMRFPSWRARITSGAPRRWSAGCIPAYATSRRWSRSWAPLSRWRTSTPTVCPTMSCWWTRVSTR